MNRIDRLIGILIRLQGQPQTAGQLADRFEVSQRTILRDIDALSQIGVPIIATTGRNGGYEIASGFWLPPLRLTPEEATVVLLALDQLGDETSSPLGAAHRMVLEKVRSTLHPATRTVVDSNRRSLQVVRDGVAPSDAVLTRMRSAVELQEWVEITYAGVNGTSIRAILPMLIYVAGGRWYTRAIDARRSGVRHFRIDRMELVRSTTAPPNGDEIFRRATSEAKPYADVSHPEVRARLTPKGTIFARDHPDFRDSIIPDRNGVQLVFRCPPGELPYYGRELLRFGAEVQVSAPVELKRWMIACLNDLLQHHQMDPES